MREASERLNLAHLYIGIANGQVFEFWCPYGTM